MYWTNQQFTTYMSLSDWPLGGPQIAEQKPSSCKDVFKLRGRGRNKIA